MTDEAKPAGSDIGSKVDEAAKSATDPHADLKVLIKGTDGKVKIKDKEGKVHELPPLDLADLIDLEERTGISVLGMSENTDMKLKDMCYLLYLSLRKEGLSPEQISKKNWTLTERQIYMMFDLNFLKNSISIFLELLAISGLDAIRPPKAATRDGEGKKENQ